jgi:hypothetical protein
LASSQAEAQEWVAAINSNVKALNDARNGLPGPLCLIEVFFIYNVFFV